MSFRDLIPWGRSRPQTPTLYRDALSHPFFPLQREMNRLFDDMFHVFDEDGTGPMESDHGNS